MRARGPGGAGAAHAGRASAFVPYSQEYLSLLARKGALGAFKRGRNWYITREALERYVMSIQEKRSRAAE